MNKMYEYQQVFSSPVKYSEDTLRDILARLLDEERYQHVLRVLDTANDLVDVCGGYCENDRGRVVTAVLLHDLAKGMNISEQKEFAYAHGISLVGVPSPVYHAIIGAWMARNYFDIEDQDILDAVHYHTTGSINFIKNKIGAILFLADYLEPGREMDCSHIHSLIPQSILLGLKEVVKEKIISVIQRDRALDQESISFYHALIN